MDFSVNIPHPSKFAINEKLWWEEVKRLSTISYEKAYEEGCQEGFATAMEAVKVDLETLRRVKEVVATWDDSPPPNNTMAAWILSIVLFFCLLFAVVIILGQ
jgi:peptidoglycan/LPS O-acetylase OafA/YrhL